MFKIIKRMLLIAALCVPWATQAQDLSDYSFATGSDASAWVTLSSAATEVTAIYDDDEASSVMNIGFPFMFCGETYTQWSCNSNGRIALGSTAVDTWWVNPFVASNITNSRTVFPLIAALGMDNTLEGTGVWVKYEVVGTAPNRMLVIEYRTPSEYDPDGALVNYQIQLEETTNIVRFVYGTSAASSYDDFQIGMANSTTDVVTVNTNDTVAYGATSSVWSDWPGANRYYEFTHPVISCPRPSALTASDITQDSITISWTAGGSETSWIVSDGTNSYVVSTPSYSFSQLTPITEYTLSVRAICGVGDTSDAKTIICRTACGAISQLPYFNDFEDEPSYLSGTTPYAEAFPNCWTRINDASGSYNYYPYISTSSTYLIHGSKSMYWYLSTTTTYADNEYAVLPAIDLSVYDMSDLTFAFYAKTTATTAPWPQFIVGVMTNPSDATTFVPVETVTLTSTATLYAVSLADYTGNGAYVAIRCPRTSSARYASLDDVMLTDEWCDIPTNVTVSSTTSEVTVSWSNDDNRTFTVFLGNDTISNVNDSYYTFTNLDANSEFTYGVAAECSSSISSFVGGTIRTQCYYLDSMPYVMDFEGTSVGTSSGLSFVPCLNRLNNGTTYFGYPYVSGTASYNHTDGGNRGLYWCNSSTTTTYGDYQVVVMPGIDTNSYPINTLELKFWARATSSSYMPEFKIGVMTNPNDINTFQQVGSVTVNGTEFDKYVVSLANYSGEGQFIAIRANRPGSTWYAAIDDITIETLPICPSVVDMAIEGVTASGAIVSWNYRRDTPGVPTGFDVVLTDSTGTSTTFNTTDTYMTFTGLDPHADYTVRVSADCESDGNGEADSIAFTTGGLPCLLSDPSSIVYDTIGHGTSTSNYIPSYSFYNYGLSQQIYTANEIGSGGNITKISVMPSAVAQQRTFEIYMAHTSATTLSSFIHPTDMVKVYDGAAVTLTANQWLEFTLNTPFAYNGSDNLLVCFRDMTGSYTSGNSWYTHSISGNSVYLYQDGSAYNPFTTTGGNTTSNRNNAVIVLESCAQEATCTNPFLTVTSIDTNEITLTWIPGYQESSWDLEYRTSGGTWQTIQSGVSTTTYTVTGLTPATTYEFRLSFTCDTNVYAANVTATTQCVPLSLPFFTGFESSEGFTTGTAGTLPNNCWYKFTNYSTSYYPYPSNSQHHSGSNSMYMYTYTYNSYCYFTIPQLDAQLDSLLVSFWLYKSSNSYPTAKMQVGVMTDPTDYSTFTAVDEVVPNYGDGWTLYEVNMSSYHGDPGNIAFVCPVQGSSASYPYMYIDDITIDYIPSCMHVSNVYADYASNDTIILKWTPGGNETAWEILNVNDSVYFYSDADSVIIDNLTGNTYYTFEIRSICDVDDTSWSFAYSTYSACTKIATLPLVQDFEDVATGTSSTSSPFALNCWTRQNNGTSYGGYPYVGASASYNHTDNGGKGLYWYNSTTTGTYGDYQIIVLPEVDTTVLPINTLMLTFWAKPSSVSYQPVFYVGTMPHPDSVDAFAYYDTIVVNYTSTDWQKYVVQFNNYADTNSFIAIRANRPASSWYAYVDDITLDLIPDCAPVEDITVSVGTVSAMVSWTPMQTYSNGVLVEYKETDASSWNSVTTTNDYVALTNLDPSTEYEVRVIGQCDESNSNAVSETFTTNEFGCVGLSENMIGDPSTTTTNYTIPVNNYYRNTMSQQLILSSELGANVGPIRSVSFDYAYSSPSTEKDNCEIWIGLTGLTSLSASQYLDTSAMTKVYTGPINCVQGWNTFSLLGLGDTVIYPGDTNIVVCIIDNSDEYDGSSYVFHTTPATGMAMAFYSDSYDYYTNPTGMNQAAYNYRTNMKLAIGECQSISTCAEPPVIVTDVTPYSVNIAWTAGSTETAWNLYYHVAGTSTIDTAATNVTVTTYQFTGLQSGTNYEFIVEPVCNDVLNSRVSTTTECAAISQLPYTENFNNSGTGTGVLPNCWSRMGSYSTYTYISGTYNHSGLTGGSVYMYQGSSASYTSRLILPELDTTLYQVNQTQLVFHVYHSSSSYCAENLEVGVSSDPMDANSFVPVDTVVHSGTVGQWEIFEVPLSSYTGNGTYVTIKSFYTSGYTYFYVDDVTLELIPTCPRPDSLTADNATPNSVDLSWNERGGASSWIIEYGPRGFALGTGTTVVANTNPFTLSGLPVAYVGEYYVRSVCSSTDTGEYSRFACPFASSQIPATLPYLYTFEDATEWQNWQTTSNVNTVGWNRGNATASEGSYAMYISNDGGVSWASNYTTVVNAAAYRDIDFGTTPVNAEVTFRAKAGGCFGSSIRDGIYVIMVDPSDEMTTSNAAYTNPWGYMPTVNVYQDSLWDTYTLFFDSVSGIKRIAINWYNTNSQSLGTIVQGGGAVDSFAVVVPTCQRPNALTATTTSTTANLAWNGDASATYQVVYRPYPNGTANTMVTANTNSLVLSGLDPLTQYAYWVRKVCGAGDTSHFSTGLLFSTQMCESSDTLIIDSVSTTSTSYNVPVNNYFRYTLCEFIVDSAELVNPDNPGPRDLNAIMFHYDYATGTSSKTDVDIYIMPTSDSVFASTTDMRAIDSTAVLVYSGDLNCEQGWNQFNFSTPFSWDGQSNIIVVVDDNSYAYNGSSYKFTVRNCNGNKTIDYYSDSNDPDVNNPSGYSGSKYLRTFRPEMMFISCGGGVACPVPAVLPVTDLSYNTATINWSSNATVFEIAVKVATDADYPVATLLNDEYSYSLTNLVPATLYRFRVRAICDADEGVISEWIEGSFTTDSLPCFAPSGMEVTDLEMNTATFDWTVNGEETAWRIHVWNTSFDQTYDVTSHPATITGLTKNTQYNAAVMAVCGGILESEASDTVSFTTLDCPVPTNVAVSNVTAHSATISWNGNAASYTLEYGSEGYPQGDGTAIANITGNSYELTDLYPGYAYDVYVMANCDAQNGSDWSTKATFTTLVGIDGVEGSMVTLYPNPTSNSTTITLSGVNGDVTIAIVDMNGRTVRSETLSCEGDCAKTMQVNDLAQGAYFVRISGENVNMVKKLVVK